MKTPTKPVLYAYLLYDYGEYGPENLVATVERHKLPGLLESNWPYQDWRNEPTFKKYPPPDPEALDAKTRREHREWIDGEKDGLAALLDQKTDEELATSDSGWGLGHGWGGIKLHVVKLDMS